MFDLKDEILQALNNDDKLKNTLKSLPIYQKNLLKNYTNPIFNDADRDKILNDFTLLQEIGNSLYRYNSLKENDYRSAAEIEKTDIENAILKGGISYNRYVWHSENSEHTCDVCKSLDGQVFDFYDEVPERPHPNCKCTIECEKTDDINFKKNNLPKQEPCNLTEQIDILIDNLEDSNKTTNKYIEDIKSDIEELENDLFVVNKLIENIDSQSEILAPEYGKHIPDCENNIDNDFEHIQEQKITLNILWNDIQKLLELGWVGIGSLTIFALNYVALLFRAYGLKQYELDKYYHSKANCEATQIFGELGEEAAILLSDTKEKFDQWNNIYAKSHKVTIEEAIADSERDQIANRLGRERGRKYPYCKCYELMQDLKPKQNKE